MAVTIALCVLTSAYVFGQIEPYVAEVTGYDNETAVPEVAQATDEEPEEETADTDPPPENEPVETPAQEVEGQPTISSSESSDSTSTEFTPTHSSNPDFTINFRPGPSVSSGDPIGSLDPGTPLMFLDEEALDEEGVVWLRVQTGSGQEGWIREVDTQPIIQ